MSRRRRPGAEGGFTLIELMITLVIVALLASAATVGYSSYARDAKRSEARALLVERANRMLRHKHDKGDFAMTVDEKANIEGTSTKDASGKFDYRLTHSGGAGSYTLTATATFTDADCPALTLDHLGRQRPEACW